MFIISAVFLMIFFFLTILDEPWHFALRSIFSFGVFCACAYLFFQSFFSESDGLLKACFVIVAWIWSMVAAESLNHQRGGSILGFFRKKDFHYNNSMGLIWLAAFALTSFMSFKYFQLDDLYLLRRAYYYAWFGTLQISAATIGFIRPSSPCTFREKGIALSGCGLIKWINIDSYSWEAEQKTELCLILKGKRRFFKKKSIRIILDDIAASERILIEYLPLKSVSTASNT